MPSTALDTEETLYNPCSRKGEVRARIATMFIACELSGRPYNLQVPPRWILTVLGVFVPIVRENMEMLYQCELNYLFDSGKLERAFGLAATDYRKGIAATLRD